MSKKGIVSGQESKQTELTKYCFYEIIVSLPNKEQLQMSRTN